MITDKSNIDLTIIPIIEEIILIISMIKTEIEEDMEITMIEDIIIITMKREAEVE